MSVWFSRVVPIAILLAIITIVVARLPKVELGHSKAFTTRRFLNWFPLGLTYAFLYMARYNLAAAKNDLGDLITNEDFGTIKAAGTIVYGVSFLINGPLTDRIGGRATMLLAAMGSALANFAMGALLIFGTREHVVELFIVLYAINMYFQSFGAVSIVKVNAAWFHLRERGTFGGIFGILIALGLYFAFDWCAFIAEVAPTEWVFFVPAMLLLLFFGIDWFLVRDTPGDAGQKDFETGDAQWGAHGVDKPGIAGTLASVLRVGRAMLSQPVILVIAAIEFCSGFLRSALMDWYALFTRQTHVTGDFVASNWGMMQCIAGILGGVIAGIISDRVFGSRRGPVAAILYGVMLGGAVAMSFALEVTPLLSGIVVVMMLAIIGVHGMLSGAASMDFGGRKNVGVVVGIIDGLVYLGQGVQYMTLGHALPSEAPANAVPSNWWAWPFGMIPVSLIGLLLATRVWNARPKGATAH